MAARGKETVRRMLDEVWNKGNVDFLDEAATTDCAFRESGGALVGLEQEKAHIGGLLDSLSDVRASVDDLVGEGGKVAARWSWSATHTGEFMGIAPRGERLEGAGMSFYRMEDGKIAEAWTVSDRLGLMGQLGMVPPMR